MAANKTTAETVKKPPTKTEILTHIAENTGLSRNQVNGVFESLNGLLAKNLKPSGAGVFNLPGLLKIQAVKKPATKARRGINPFTGEETIFKAKPAHKVVKVTPLKRLKELV